ncbi:MAG: hypothetical protein IAI48_19200, partial [Candidatus Eremiobacteraeota bacterium]|nr:hypothetical protein [Candidatus Eremiobacteraeota bacterium]
MEPFCAPDGTLFYNTRNGAGERPELRYATRTPIGGLVDRGVVRGTESALLNGV